MITCVSSECIFGVRCGEVATWRSPAGPLCDACAKEKIEAVSRGGTLLNVIAAARGISRDDLLSKFVRIEEWRAG